MIRITKDNIDTDSPDYGVQDYTLDTTNGELVWLAVGDVCLALSNDEDGVYVTAYRNGDEMGRPLNSMFAPHKEN